MSSPVRSPSTVEPENPSNTGLPAAIEMVGVSVWLADGKFILRDIDWRVHNGEQWALLGPNGSGKTTLLSLAGAIRHPSDGNVNVLGERLGQTSMWDLRARIGNVEPSQKILEWIPIEEVVLTGLTGTVWPLADRIRPADREKARELLDLVGCPDMVDRTIGTCSQGERQRVRIARALMADPELLLLDEPATGLDLPAREALLSTISRLEASHPDMGSVFVSHHLEEIPPTTTHAMLLREGRISAIGPVSQVLTSECISACFGFPVKVTLRDRRWSARASASWHDR